MFEIGSFLREERERLGILQRELAEGMCHKDTISRIENGSQMPSAALFNYLTEQLGVSGYSYGDFFSQGTVRRCQLKWEIVDSLIMLRLERIPGMLSELQKLSSGNRWDDQFFVFAKGWYFFLESEDAESFFEACRKALLLVHPRFALDGIRHARLFQGDCRILNAMALSMWQAADHKKAASILNQLIINQRNRAKSSFGYWENLAVLYHNAALCEKNLYPRYANRHISRAEEAVIRSGNSLLVIRIMRTKVLLFGEDHEDFQTRREAMLLKQCFQKVNCILCIYEDFWEFLRERPYLFMR